MKGNAHTITECSFLNHVGAHHHVNVDYVLQSLGGNKRALFSPPVFNLIYHIRSITLLGILHCTLLSLFYRLLLLLLLLLLLFIISLFMLLLFVLLLIYLFIHVYLFFVLYSS